MLLKLENKKNFYIFSILWISLFTLLAYANSFHCSFQFDDLQYIINNKDIRGINSVAAYWNTQKHESRLIAFYSFALNYHFHKLDVFGYHCVNFLVHLINAGLVFWIVLLLFRTPQLKETSIKENDRWIALSTALIFALHPIQTQAVTYIVQRFASLATLFYLLSMALYLKGRLERNWWCFVIMGVSILAGMFTKEIVFTLPIILILIEGFFINGFKEFLRGSGKWVLVAFGSTLLIIPLIFSFNLDLIFHIPEPVASGSHEGDMITSGNYLLTQFSVMMTYFCVLLVPINLNLDYDYPLSRSFFEAQTFIGFLVISLILLIAIYRFRKDRLISFGIFFFFISASVESSFIPIQHVIFEHRMYLPMFGYALSMTCIVAKFIHRPLTWLLILLGLASLLANLTFERNKVWKTEITMWEDIVIKSPNKPRPHLNLGRNYFLEKKYGPAVNEFSKAIMLDPNYYQAYLNRGNTYSHMRKFDLAVADLTRAILLNENSALAYNDRGVAYLNMKKFDLALNDFNKAFSMRKGYLDPLENKIMVYMFIGKDDEAINTANELLALDPKNPRAFEHLGVIYARQDKFNIALAYFDNAIQNDPSFAGAYINRSFVHQKVGNYKQALEDAVKAKSLGMAVKEDYFQGLKQKINQGSQK